MISIAVPIAILTAASLASAQTPATPDVKPITPMAPIVVPVTPAVPVSPAVPIVVTPAVPIAVSVTSVAPIPLQIAQASMFAGGQTITSSGGNTVSTSADGNTVMTTADGKTVMTSKGKKAVTISSGGQGKDTLFAGTEKFSQGASQSTEINLDPDTMAMMNSHGKNADLAKKVKFMSIRTYEYDRPGMYKMEDVDVFRKKLDDGTWNCSVRVREKNESTDICSRLASDHETREMVILTAEPKELTFIHMSGNMSLEDLGKAAGSMGKAEGAFGKAESTLKQR